MVSVIISGCQASGWYLGFAFSLKSEWLPISFFLSLMVYIKVGCYTALNIVETIVGSFNPSDYNCLVYAAFYLRGYRRDAAHIYGLVYSLMHFWFCSNIGKRKALPLLLQGTE